MASLLHGTAECSVSAIRRNCVIREISFFQVVCSTCRAITFAQICIICYDSVNAIGIVLSL